MPGGQLQLNSISGNKSFLNVKPQTSYFNTVYYKYHNYAKITHYLEFNTAGDSNFLKENKFTINIPKNGDLIKEFYISVTLPELTLDSFNGSGILDIKWIDNICYNIIKTITFSIGGNIIQTFDSVFLYTYYTSLINNEQKYRLNNLNKVYYNIGDPQDLTKCNIESLSGCGSGCSGCYGTKSSPILLKSNKLLIPIPVFFSKEPFPVLSLEYNTLDIVLETNPLSELVLCKRGSGSGDDWLTVESGDYNIRPVINPTILLNYIYLHKGEILQYYVNTYQFLIETYQLVSECDILNERVFNYKRNILKYGYESFGPTKDIFILPRRSDYKKRGEFFNFTNAPYMNKDVNIIEPGRNIIENMSIKFNAIMRLEEKHWSYFTDLELFKSYISSYKNNNIYIYNFSLEPCWSQPSGHCNLTHINTIMLQMEINEPACVDTTLDLMIYNRYYNILQVENGFAKLLYFK